MVSYPWLNCGECRLLCRHYAAMAVAAFTRLLGVIAAPFWLGHTDAKQFHMMQLYLLSGCKYCQSMGKLFSVRKLKFRELPKRL